MTQESQSHQGPKQFHVPVIVVVVLAVCAALLVMNGARPSPSEGNPGRESTESDPKPSPAKPRHVGSAESNEHIHQAEIDPNASSLVDSPGPEVPSGDTPEPESIGQTLPEEH